MTIPYVIEAGKNGNDKVYDLYSRLLKDRIIFITGAFEDVMANSVVAQLLFLNAQNDNDIYIYINSPGGNISSMFAIYDTMCYVTPEINTIGIGSVASAGSFILAAGTKGKRSCLANTEIMIHEFSAGIEGKAHDLFYTMDRYKRLYDKMAGQYVEFTGQDLNKIQEDMKKDFWLSPDEAVEYGLIDKVVKRLPDKKRN